MLSSQGVPITTGHSEAAGLLAACGGSSSSCCGAGVWVEGLGVAGVASSRGGRRDRLDPAGGGPRLCRGRWHEEVPDALSLLVARGLGRDLFSGDFFLFVSKNHRRAKVLYFDVTGQLVFAKRLEKGGSRPRGSGPRARPCSSP